MNFSLPCMVKFSLHIRKYTGRFSVDFHDVWVSIYHIVIMNQWRHNIPLSSLSLRNFKPIINVVTSSWTNEDTVIHCLPYHYAKPINVFYFPISRMLRETIPPKILMNLCTAIICLNIVFLVGVDRDEKSNAGCKTVAFLLQYFFLAIFCWSGIEGFHSARGLVFPMKVEISHFVLKSCLFGWGEFSCRVDRNQWFRTIFT